MEYYNKHGRWIEAPKAKLKAIQTRFSRLLAQIETPDYLHSAVRKRSYVSNAQSHTVQGSTVKIDIKKFYGSARSAQVYSFLTEKLEWSADVAGMMTRLLTHNGHLPTGGSASPLLSFWVYKDLFDAVEQAAGGYSATFSLYVDDMTITGAFVRRRAIYDVRRLVGQSRLKAHKVKFFPSGAPKVVTGVVQTVRGAKVPYVRQGRIRDAVHTLRHAQTEDARYEALKPLVGRLCEATEIDPSTWKVRRDRAIRQKQAIERARLARQVAVPVIPAVADHEPAVVADAPWD